MAACTLPGLVVILLLPAHTLLHWIGGDSYDGATSIVQTIETVAQASLYRLSPHILNPLLLPVLMQMKRLLIPALVGLVLLYSLLVVHGRTRLDRTNKRLFVLGVVVAGIAVLSLCFHWVSFFLFSIPLPQNRAAIWLVPIAPWQPA